MKYIFIFLVLIFSLPLQAVAGPVGPNTYVQFLEYSRVNVVENTHEFVICPDNAYFDEKYGNQRCENKVNGVIKNAWLPLRNYTQVGYKLVFIDVLMDFNGGTPLVLYWEPTAQALAADKLHHQ